MKLSNKDRGADDSMTVFNKLLAQVQDSAPKSQVMMNNAPTEQDILANLLGQKMKIESHSQPRFQGKNLFPISFERFHTESLVNVLIRYVV